MKFSGKFVAGYDNLSRKSPQLLYFIPIHHHICDGSCQIFYLDNESYKKMLYRVCQKEVDQDMRLKNNKKTITDPQNPSEAYITGMLSCLSQEEKKWNELIISKWSYAHLTASTQVCSCPWNVNAWLDLNIWVLSSKGYAKVIHLFCQVIHGKLAKWVPLIMSR